MRQIYQSAKDVIIWLGPDSPEGFADIALASIRTISDFLSKALGVTLDDLSSRANLYHEVLYQNRASLPRPDECNFSNEPTWQSLVWFYTRTYFTRTWCIQEVNASRNRLVHCGHGKIEWDLVDLVAGYIIMDTSFSQEFGFSKTHCWCASTVTTERMRQPQNWLAMLYLASNFACTDARDRIFALRGLMTLRAGAQFLEPAYSHPTVAVYRDSVHAALLDFENTNVLLYVSGDEEPSWIPRWDRAMLFRNPFRFGKALPWKPAGETKAVWRIADDHSILTLSGFPVDTIRSSETYNENYFSDSLLKTEERRRHLQLTWKQTLSILTSDTSSLLLSTDVLTAIATAFSYGLDAEANPADEQQLLRTFVAYLRIVLDEETFEQHIPSSVEEKSQAANGHAFGKPVWDFKYPDSGFFVTVTGLIGCAISPPMPGDIVFVALGSTYPMILRPADNGYLLKGYCFVRGVMHGEYQHRPVCDVRLH